MPHPLEGAWTKADRAREHLETLQAEIAAHAAGPAVVVVRLEIAPRSDHYNLVVDAVPEAPLIRWGVAVGDIVHNLRSALDHLAYQLVRYGRCSDLSRREMKQVQFPIHDTRSDFRESLTRRLPGVGLRQVGMIEREQPYKRYNDVSFSPLRRLRELSNADKHRVVTPIVFPTQEPVPSIEVQQPHRLEHVAWFLHQPVAPGAVVAQVFVAPTSPEPQLRLIGQFSSYVAFEDGARASVYFGGMLGAVERILESFHPFLDSPD